MSEERYPFREVESHWREVWEKENVHNVDLDDPEGEKKYILVMFSYPSSSKLHIGHWWNYGPTDTYARFQRMRGYRVFEPMGFDSFGLPAENYAIKVGTHPGKVTEESIEFIRDQLKQIGAMYDWRWEVVTSRPDYYRWIQWLFLKLYEHDLAYQKDGLVNWCPSCQTVLANEQVLQDGSCERCGSSVSQRKMTQWYVRITRYADKLLEGLKEINWPESTVKRQENWIGRSEGASIRFAVEGQEALDIEVFTTRPDTLYGVTYVVLAPENDLVERLTTEEHHAQVRDYVETSLRMSEVDRTSTSRDKTGEFTGAWVIHPLTGERLPVWTADYVLGSYGTGAVMAVPAHDQRDFEFARKHELPIHVVIRPPTGLIEAEELEEAYEEPGVMMNSGDYSGLPSEHGKKLIVKRLESLERGRGSITYRIRDWSVSRQRYWGAPIPMIHCPACGAVPVPEEQLPVRLPDDIKDFKPRGTSPLGAVEEWMNVECPKCGGAARRDPDTLDTFVDSSFYHLRYLAADQAERPLHPERMKNWLPIDTYVGGPEHGTGHLIYVRFITRFLYDIGLCPVAEPAQKLIHQGIITKDGQRMSKSKGNVVNPDAFIDLYGSDVFRMYLMFTGDYRLGGDWSDEGITGIDRFVNRVWRLVVRYADGVLPTSQPIAEDYPAEVFRTLHHMIQAVGDNLETFTFNTAISRMMELVNALYLWIGDDNRTSSANPEAMRRLLAVFLRVLAPFAPHFTEEAWRRLGGTSSVFLEKWPDYIESALKADTITLVVQINGKLRDRIEAPSDASQDDLRELALASDKIRQLTEGLTLRKAIVVPGKLVNLVVG